MKSPLSSPTKPNTPIRRVAILFSGGPAPAANAVIASAASCFSRNGIEVLGIQNGYSRLMVYDPKKPLEDGVAYKRLDHKTLDGARNSQGIMIGTSRANPGKLVQKPADFDDPKCTAPLQVTYDALRSLGVDALISIGGDDTLTTAAKFKLFQDKLPAGSKRIRVVHLPKTIDNDYVGIDFTFGYFTAVEMLAAEIYNLLNDSRATGTYYIVQVMGRQAGWLAYGAAIAGEASLVIGWEDVPAAWKSTEEVIEPKTGQKRLDKEGKPQRREVFDLRPVVDRIVETVVAREKEGNRFGVIVVAEGMAEFLTQAEMRECLSESEYRSLEPDPHGHFPVSQLKFTGYVSRLVAKRFEELKQKGPRLVGLQLGYETRCHRPTAFDVMLGSQLGVGAYRGLAEEGHDGVLVSVEGQLDLVYRPFDDLMNRETLRAKARPIAATSPEQDFHKLARYLEVRVDEK
jgi:ATP-dependent phosphofructokinase / diphosphate-dependent phosphofructokinase